MAESALRQLVPQSAEPFVRSYNPFNPAFRETIRATASDLLGGRAIGGTPSQRYRAQLADLLTGSVDFMPGVSDAVAVSDTVQAARGGDYGTAAILGGSAMLGMVPVIGDSASRAIREGLDMSQAARMQRAKEQAFDERVFYHGGASDIYEFITGRRGNYFTNNPDIANIYAMNAEKRWPGQNNAGPNVLPVRLRGPALVVSDQRDGSGGWYKENLQEALGIDLSQIPVSKRAQALREEAKRQGYGFLEITDMDDLGGRQSQFISLDPANIRSVNAAFDPAKTGSSNLMAEVGGAAVGLSALNQLVPRNEERRPD